jgi:aminoglycoside phosphotransferase (APT) family kinase protein
MASGRAALARLIASELRAGGAEIVELRRLPGGAVREHWLVVAEVSGGACAGRHRLVLRSDGRTPLGIGLDLMQEFALLQTIHRAGIPAPEPLLCCGDAAIIGRPFHLTRWVAGEADPERVVAAGPSDALAEQLGRAAAAIHAISPACAELSFLGAPPTDPAMALLAEYRGRLDAIGEKRPVAEWGLRWLARNLPPPAAPVLCHGDFRTGNYLVEDGALAAILDWEFAGWGDPDSDLGWFCSRCWRFSELEREAGGIASRAALYRGYEAEAGRWPDPRRLRFWEVMAALKWLVIALLQRDRFLKQGERSLDLALTGRRAAECEFELLRLTAGEHEKRP